MKKLLMVAVCGILMLNVVGCAGVMGAPLFGFVYSDYKYPHVRTEVVNNGVGSKQGMAMAKSILGIVAIGDASVEQAMRQGNIQQIHTVDHHIMSILGLYTEWTTLITGE